MIYILVVLFSIKLGFILEIRIARSMDIGREMIVEEILRFIDCALLAKSFPPKLIAAMRKIIPNCFLLILISFLKNGIVKELKNNRKI